MHVWEHRPLTAGEIAIGRSVFNDSVDWTPVRVLQAPPFAFGAMVPLGRTIVFGRWRAPRDFVRAPLNEQGWFAHELAHVWQASHGKALALAKLRALGKSAYFVKQRTGAKLDDYNIEAQAEIVRYLFLARAGKPDAGSPNPDWLESIWRSEPRA
jgi:hypothetical protein